MDLQSQELFIKETKREIFQLFIFYISHDNIKSVMARWEYSIFLIKAISQDVLRHIQDCLRKLEYCDKVLYFL